MCLNGFKILTILCLFNLSGSCSSFRKAKPEQIKTLIEEKLGPNFTQETNSSGDFALYTQKPAEADIKVALKFVVVDVMKNTIIYENSFLPGYVKWHSETTLEVLSIPGIIQTDEDLSHYKKVISIASPKH